MTDAAPLQHGLAKVLIQLNTERLQELLQTAPQRTM
jgi:hypothetical protein